MSRDGSSPNDFHKLCDNKGPTLTLIETSEGYKFGGYTPIHWDNSGVKFDNETFIFSLNKMKKYTKIKDTRTLNCNINYGPIFGDDDFYIQENMKKLNVHPYRTFLDKKELMISEKNESLKFWGKIPGDDSDYYIALATNYKNHYEFPEKKFYFSTPNFVFELLPETFEYHDKDFLDSYYKPLKGNPNLVIKQYGGAAPAEGENPENNNENPPPENPENPEENKPATTNIQDPDASVDDNAPIPEPPKENFTEKLKLSYLVRQIDYDTNIFPEGALCLTTDHEIRVNKSFKGLCKENIGNMEKFLHFRRVSQEKRELINQPDAVFRYDIFDDITKDTVKGSWTIELDPTKTICNLRSLLWPGYFAVHQSGTKNYCGVYLGNGFKNAELPFMI